MFLSFEGPGTGSVGFFFFFSLFPAIAWYLLHNKIVKLVSLHRFIATLSSKIPFCLCAFVENLHPPYHNITHFAACQFSVCRKKSGQLLLDSWKNRATPEPNNFLPQRSREESLLPHEGVWVEGGIIEFFEFLEKRKLKGILHNMEK